jgi:hypothetical protein
MGNGISESLDSKIFRVSMPGPLENLCIYGAQLVMALLLAAFENFEPGTP